MRDPRTVGIHVARRSASCPPRVAAARYDRSRGRGRAARSGLRAPERQGREGQSLVATRASPSSSTSIPRTTRPAARCRPARSATRGASSRPGAVVLGVSPDSASSHEKFRDKYGLPFTLLADAEQWSRSVRRLGREVDGGQEVHGHRALDVRDRRRGQRRAGDAPREARRARRRRACRTA